MKVQDKVIVVTGAAGGIGGALAKTLLAKGARVAAVDLRQEALEQFRDSVAKEARERLSLHAVNIIDKEAVTALPHDIIAAHGAVDGLINNAGIIQPFVTVEDIDYDAVERVMQVNFYGTLYTVKSFLPHLKARPEAHIVNVSSMGGFLPVPGQSVYGASKAAVKLLSEGLYGELRSTSVRVSAVFPGATATNITENSGVAAPDIGADAGKYPMISADEAAKIIVAGIEKNKLRIYTGKDSRSMQLLYRIAPTYATNLIAKKMQGLLKK